MKKRIFAAAIGCLPEALAFIDEELAGGGLDKRTKNLLRVACEEVLVNIMSYAYDGLTGDVEIVCGFLSEPDRFAVYIKDWGKAYNPLKNEPPNLEMEIEEKPIGGLGIYMYRTIMDEVVYSYEDGCNILKLYKSITKAKEAKSDEAQ